MVERTNQAAQQPVERKSAGSRDPAGIPSLRYKSLRACLNFAQPHFEGCFRGYFSVVMRSVAGYVTNRAT